MELSEYEHRIIKDTDFLKTKIDVIAKVEVLFEEVRILLKNSIDQIDIKSHRIIDTKIGKTFRGENYKSLPYVVLDYPNLFSNTNIFAFRTMFWWGNFFSSTLHLQGESLDNFREQFVTSSTQLLNDDIYICVNTTPWEYHYKNDNYILLDESNIYLLDEVNFLKLSKKFNIDNYTNLPALSNLFFQKCLNIIIS